MTDHALTPREQWLNEVAEWEGNPIPFPEEVVVTFAMIAAAPDMLALLKAVVAELDTSHLTPEIKAAIARAEGQS